MLTHSKQRQARSLLVLVCCTRDMHQNPFWLIQQETMQKNCKIANSLFHWSCQKNRMTKTGEKNSQKMRDFSSNTLFSLQDNFKIHERPEKGQKQGTFIKVIQISYPGSEFYKIIKCVPGINGSYADFLTFKGLKSYQKLIETFKISYQHVNYLF